MPYQQMHRDWHGLAKKAAKTDSSWQGCCALVRAAVACFVVVLCYRSCRVQCMDHGQHPYLVKLLPKIWELSSNFHPTISTPEQRVQTCACSAMLSGGWSSSKALIFWGESMCFCSTSVFLSYMIGMIEVEVRNYPKYILVL